MTDPTLTAALASDGAWFFGAIKIALPDYDLCLLDGAGEISFGGDTYRGQDATFGTINALDPITEAEGDEAPEWNLSLYPANGAATADLANAAMQGSIVQIFVGVMDPATGAPIGTPEVKALMEIDTAEYVSELGSREVQFTLISVFERLFEVDEGVRASDGYHQSIWPGELGLQYMTGTDRNLYWGGKRPVGQLAGSGFNNFGGGGGSGSGGITNERLFDN